MQPSGFNDPERAKAHDDARHNALVENTAQAIFYEIQDLDNSRQDNEQRWVWELLQNALDATLLGQSTRIRVNWDGVNLTFEHNGDSFKPDEIAHLIYHGSTKYRDSSKRGRFGRGFLVTHLLSKKVHVRGSELILQGQFPFDVEMNRCGDADEIRQQMDSAWDSFNRSQRPSSALLANDEYRTQYSYATDELGQRAAASGISAIARCAPYVLAFAPELEEVRVNDREIITVWQKEYVRKDLMVHGLYCTHIQVTRSHPDHIDGDTPVESLTVYEARSTQEDELPISVAIILRDGQSLDVVPSESLPRLFALSLPLIGTEGIPLPAVMHSNVFEPQPDRMGIHAAKADTPQQKKNWSLLAKTADLYLVLLRYASQQQCSNLHLMANLGPCPQEKWLDSDRFTKEVLQPIVHEIITKQDLPLVKNTHGEYVPVTTAVVPVDDPEEKLFDLLSNWRPVDAGLVDRSLLSYWADALSNLSQVLESEEGQLQALWTPRSLATQVASIQRMDILIEKVQCAEGETVLQWLNSFISLLIGSTYENLLSQLELVLGQDLVLHKLTDLFKDDAIDERLKDISERAGFAVRSALLHSQIRGLEEKMNVKTESDVLSKLLAESAQLNPDVNAMLVAWLASRPSYHKHLNGYPVFTLGVSQTLDKNRPLLRATALWPLHSAEYVDLFPKDYILAEVYASELTTDDWQTLKTEGLLYDALTYVRDVKNPDDCLIEGSLDEGDEQISHELKGPVRISDLCFLDEKDKGIIDVVRNSKPKARRFIKFIFEYLRTNDQSWKAVVSADCTCGKKHNLVPCGWLERLSHREWLPLGNKKNGRPTAENIDGLIDETFLSIARSDDDSALLMQRLGIGVSDLFKIKITDPEERLRADRLAAKMYGQDSAGRAFLSSVIDDPDVRAIAEKHLEQKRITARNQLVGKQVEELLKAALKAERIAVKRTGIGSDYEVQNDYIEDGVEQWLAVGKYLLEVKATSTSDVRMTLVQGNVASNLPEEYSDYALCVCTVGPTEVTEADVRSHSRFVFGIGAALKDAVETGNDLKGMENSIKEADDEEIRLEIIDSSKRLRISQAIWEAGLNFDDAAELFRK